MRSSGKGRKPSTSCAGRVDLPILIADRSPARPTLSIYAVPPKLLNRVHANTRTKCRRGTPIASRDSITGGAWPTVARSRRRRSPAGLDPGYEGLEGSQRHDAARYLLAPPPKRLVQLGGVDPMQPDQLPRPRATVSPSMTWAGRWGIRAQSEAAPLVSPALVGRRSLSMEGTNL